MEFTPANWVQIAVYLASFAFAWGGVSQKLKHISRDITRLESKQDKHNGLIERMAVVEAKVAANERKLGQLEKYHQQA